MRAIRQFTVALITLLLAATPALALDIASALDVNGWDGYSELERPVLEFDDEDWARFIGIDAFEFFPPGDDGASTVSDAAAGLLTRVWERP
jgi:hypothetical protein